MRHGGRALRDAGRGVVGALLFGVPFLFTMETWWIGWRMPAWRVLAFALGGLAVILVVVRQSGFKEAEANVLPAPLALAADFAELLLQVFVAAILFLFLFGIVGFTDELATIARTALLQIVPLGLGAALANHVLRATDEDASETPFPQHLALAAGGTLFFVLPIAPTEEMELMAARAGWTRLGLVVVASLVLTYLALYVLQFRGHQSRAHARGLAERLGETFAVYAVAFVICWLLLAGFGHFGDAPLASQVQTTIVLSFAGALGGAAARVVI